MRNAMMKKFIAVVLTVAMLLSVTATTAMAGPFQLTGMDPERAVSLRVHHYSFEFAPPSPPLSPGLNTLPPVPPTPNPPVADATWRMVRVQPPATWDTSAIPPEVTNFIVNGVGALPAGWFITSATLEETTSALGIAYFAAGAPGTAGTIQWAVADANRPPIPTPHPSPMPPSNPMGQGMWLVWEHYVSGGPHTGVDDQMIHPPFFVSLPTFVHVPVDPPGMVHASPAPTPPGYWVYNVNVYPKPPTPPGGAKTPGTAIPGMDADGNLITILPWTITLEIPEDVNSPTFFPVNNPAAGTGANLPFALTGGGPTPVPVNNSQFGTIDADSFIVIRDILDYRLRLISPIPTDFTVDVVLYDDNSDFVSVLPVTLTQGTHWRLVHHTFLLNATNTSVTLPDGTVETYDATRTAAGLAADAQSIQVFWVHFHHQAILNDAVVAAFAVNPDYHARVRIQFDTVTSLRYDQLDVIDNDATFAVSRNPIWDYGDDGNTPIHPVRGIEVRKLNPAGSLLCGAVFYLWRADQVEYVNPTTGVAFVPTTPLPNPPATYVPRIRTPYHNSPAQSIVTGPAAFAGLAAPPAGQPPFVPGTNIPAGSGVAFGAVAPIPARPTHAQGVGYFPALPFGVYYIFERVAPTGYRLIDELIRVELTAANTGVGNTPPFMVSINAYNVRDHVPELPLTGGAGTLMFTAAGISLMGGAGFFLFLSRKKGKSEEQ